MEKLDLKNTRWICLHTNGDFKKREVALCILESRGFDISPNCRIFADCDLIYGHPTIGLVHSLMDVPGNRYSTYLFCKKITYDDIINAYKEEE